MKRYFVSLLICCLFFFFVPGAIAQDKQWTGTEYEMETVIGIVLGWDSVENALTYEVVAVWTDPTPPMVYPLGTTTETQLTIVRIRTGHFIYKVRACNSECSDWAVTDALDANGEPYGLVIINDVEQKGKWRTFWKVPTPSPPIIEEE